MNIEDYKAALKAWVEDQSGLPTQWRDAAGGWQSKTRALLHLFAIKPRGVDHIRWAQDADEEAGEDYIPTISGVRELTLSIFVESRNQDGNNVASYYLDKLRTSLAKPRVRTALREAGLAHSTSEAIQDLSNWVDDRVESKAQLDVHFNAVINEEDRDGAESYATTFDITSDFTSPTDEGD